MIASERVAEIRRLLAEGRLSQREIARLIGVSRGTVAAISTGKRAERQRPPSNWDYNPAAPSGPLRRCLGCGALVYLPCRLCRLRERMASGKISRHLDQPEEPLQVELTGAQEKRYRRLYARRRRRGVVESESGDAKHAVKERLHAQRESVNPES